jgi:hypothetical protein
MLAPLTVMRGHSLSGHRPLLSWSDRSGDPGIGGCGSSGCGCGCAGASVAMLRLIQIKLAFVNRDFRTF